MELTQPTPQQQLKRNEEKWTKHLMDAGFTIVPSVLILRQRALELDAIDLNIIFYLAMRWWYRDKLPRPTKETLAETMKVTPRTIQRHIARLEKRKLITREARYSPEHNGQRANFYKLDGLIAALGLYAQEEIDLREANKRENAEKPIRKRPRRLQLIKTVVPDATPS